MLLIFTRAFSIISDIHGCGSTALCFFQETIFCKLKCVNAIVIYDAKLILGALVFVLITAMICGHKLNGFCVSMNVENFSSYNCYQWA